MAALQKTFKCLTCQQDIKLERKPDDSGWNRYNLDGTVHVDQQKQKKQQQQPQVSTLSEGPQLATLAREISELKDTIHILVAQIQTLRSEFKELKR